MEKSVEFKRIVRSIKQLQHQLLCIDEGMKKNEECGEEAEQKIEYHFEMCMNALAARKERLLRELGKNIADERESLIDAHQTVNKAIEMRKKILEAGSFVYSTDIKAADHIWKGIGNLPTPEVSTLHSEVYLSDQFILDIQNHGKVMLVESSMKLEEAPCPYSIAREVVVFAGSSSGYVDMKGDKAKFSRPTGITWNSNDSCLYVTDSRNHAIRKIDQQGKVSTFQREGLSWPAGIVIHHKTNSTYVTSANANTILKLTSSGEVSLFAGSGKKGCTDGLGPSAYFNCPMGIAIDQQAGTLFVSDSDNNSIRVLDPRGGVSTLAGSRTKGYADGKAPLFNDPRGIYFDESDQSLLVCDHGNNKLRRVNLDGEVSTVCEVPSPLAVTITRSPALILVSSRQNKIFKVTQEAHTTSGIVSELHQQEEEEEEATKKKKKSMVFKNPTGLVFNNDECFVVEFDNCIISKITF